MMKRLFDLLVSSFSLLILSPFLALVALLIKLDSPGQVLYR
ncbi:MAG: sugar transferase, partial [Chloroflexi bacterium]|nr:sugar transferase [Chloroflexota bacterium]